jgi:hypothetical protein
MRHRTSLISKRFIYNVVLLLITLSVGSAAQGQEERIVLQNIHLQVGERVEGIELSIKTGSFVGFEPLPMGWYLIIDNDPSQQTSIKGDARVGTAALELTDLLKLRILARKVEFGNLKFSISGTLIVTKTFENERRIALHSENFNISESPK